MGESYAETATEDNIVHISGLCILHTAYRLSKIRDHLIIGIDSVIRNHPECGVIVTGDFNQLNDNFLKSHYRFVQIVNVGTRGNAVLDKIWTNIKNVYMHPVTIAELGTSEHNMVLLKSIDKVPGSTGTVTRVLIQCTDEKEKATFSRALSLINWEPLFRLDTCEEQYVYYQTMIECLMDTCFPYKHVTRHTADKLWVTDGFRQMVRKRQHAHMSRNFYIERILRNS